MTDPNDTTPPAVWADEQGLDFPAVWADEQGIAFASTYTNEDVTPPSQRVVT